MALRANMPSEPQAPLVKSELPLIVYPPTGISDWIGWTYQQTSVQSGLIVVLPDYRARIRSVLIAEDQARLSVETELLPPEKMLLKAMADGKEVPVGSRMKDGRYPISFQRFPTSL